MKKLNETEAKAMRAICRDCDDIDGEGFTRIADMVSALMDVFFDGQVVGGYITQLSKKGYIDVEPMEDEVWVSREVFEEYS